jgi:hypothetical protein
MSNNQSNSNGQSNSNDRPKPSTPPNSPQLSTQQGSDSMPVNGEAAQDSQAQNSTPNNVPETLGGPTQLSNYLPSAPIEDKEREAWEGASNYPRSR